MKHYKHFLFKSGTQEGRLKSRHLSSMLYYRTQGEQCDDKKKKRNKKIIREQMMLLLSAQSFPTLFISGYTEIAKGIRSISCHNCNPFVTQQCSTIVCFMLPSTFHLRGYIEIAKGIGSISYHNCNLFSFLTQQCSTTNG